MKKFFATIFLAMIFLISGQIAHAQDVYVGTSNTTGRDCYLMTETIHWVNYGECNVTLKMVKPSDRNVQLLYYVFKPMKRFTKFSNSQGYSGRLTGDYPIESAMWKYICDYSEKNNLRRKTLQNIK